MKTIKNSFKKVITLFVLAFTLSAEVYILVPGSVTTDWDLLFGVLYGSVKGWANGTCNTWPYSTTAYSETIAYASCPSNVSMEASGYVLDPSTVGSEGWVRLDYFPSGIGPLIAEGYGYRNCNGGQASGGDGWGDCNPL